MKPSKFVAHYERTLGRKLTKIELDGISAARGTANGKRDAVKAMRAALLALTPNSRTKINQAFNCVAS